MKSKAQQGAHLHPHNVFVMIKATEASTQKEGV
jgi:hypothetical protein